MLWNMILDVLLRIASLNTSWLFVNPEILKLLKIIFKFLVSCTILVCVVSLIGKVLFLLFRSVFACSICKAAACLLRLWVRIPPGPWMFVCFECCVLSGRGLCDELITRLEESYRLCCVVMCDLETSSRMRRPWPALGCSAIGGKKSAVETVLLFCRQN